MTVSNTNLQANRSLELLSKLEQCVADYAKKEEVFNRDFRSRRYTSDNKHHEIVERMDARVAAQIEETVAAFDEHRERFQSVFESRRKQIERANLHAMRTLPKRTQDVKSGYLGSLQMKRFRLDRRVADDLKAVDHFEAETSDKLSAHRSNIAKLMARARNYFTGYGSFQKLLRNKPAALTDKISSDPQALLESLESKLQDAASQLVEFRQILWPRLFSYLPIMALIPLVLLGCGVLALLLGAGTSSFAIAGLVGLAAVIIIFVLHSLGAKQGLTEAEAIAASLAEAFQLHTACGEAAKVKAENDRKSINAEHERITAEINEQALKADEVEANFKRRSQDKLQNQAPRALAKNEQQYQQRLAYIASVQDERVGLIQAEADSRKQQIVATHEAEVGSLVGDVTARWDELESGWKQEITPLYQAINEMNEVMTPRFPAWTESVVESWKAPSEFTSITKFAHLDLNIAEGAPKDPRLALPGSAQVSIPLALAYPEQGSILFETQGSGGATEIGTLNNVILRMLSTTPPGKATFTIIDPVGLGQNFAGLMHLADHEESLINRRIWTQRDQIEERMSELSEHIEKVIQMYLRNEYATITEYNEKAGSVAEKYQFLVIADFPAGFSESAAAKLQSIAMSGPRCGIFTLIHWDQRQSLPDGFSPDELRKHSVVVRADKNGFVIAGESPKTHSALVFDAPPEPDLAVALVHKIGKASIDSNRVQVPFEQIAPKPNELWTGDTTNELRVAIGRTGATKHQMLAIGKGTRQHALFAGKTGSGKSTLFHVIITNLALSCSPDQVEFYLIDFKKGVEFKCYASKHLPHARVVAIESDREFALSVLQRVDDELKRRGDMFRKLGVQDIAGYKRAGGTEPMPRSLLLIDEFQEFFVDDDTIAQTASLLFDRIVRQGRAFGIHVLLGSQTLGGAYSLARATLGQMVIRVALQCNEADAYLIMDENNSAPRLLSRPGEGIYNDAAGAIEGNSPFQVVWLSDEERDEWLDKIHDLAVKRNDHHMPIVFEGNAPADIRENELLRTVLATKPQSAPHTARCWFGAPNSIKGPTEAIFQRQSGNHLLIVGQREEAALTMIGLAIIALAAQYPSAKAKFILLHASAPGSPDAEFIEGLTQMISYDLQVIGAADIGDVMNGLATDLKARLAGESDAPSVFFFVHGLHKFKKLRQEDDFSFSMSDSDSGGNPGSQFIEILSEGSSHGMHIITTVDTLNNVNRSMNRKALSEFEMRILFQMSANDSASLIDSPKASNLGLHRALFYNEHQGTLETFRPYAMPDAVWMSEAGKALG